MKDHGTSLEGKKVCVSGSGNVAIFAVQKAQQLGAKVLTMSDSNGSIYDPEGIDLDLVKEIKLVRRGRIKEYADVKTNAEYREGKRVWDIPCDVALPCATQNELDLEDAKNLQANGAYAVVEGANMPSTPEAIDLFNAAGILYVPGKASNAGGVATSALEMTQNSERLSWSFDEVDAKLHGIMKNIYASISATAKDYGQVDNFMMGANIAGFRKVADAMIAQGVV